MEVDWSSLNIQVLLSV